MSPAQSPAPEATSMSPTARAMFAGQQLIAVALTAIAVIRAIDDGVGPVPTIAVGMALLAWHGFGLSALRRLAPAGGAQRTGAVWLVGLAVLWMLALAISAEFIWLAFLLWLLAGHVLPLVWSALFSVAVFVLVALAPLAHGAAANYASIFGPLIGGIFAWGISRGYLQLLKDGAERERLVTSLARTQREMAELQDELAKSQRESGVNSERSRLAREIHDTVAQSLSSIRLLAHAGGRSAAEVEAEQLRQIEDLATDGLADVRRIVAALAPSDLENSALGGALDRLLGRLQQEVGLAVSLEVDEDLPQLPTEVEVALLRAAQSALANVRLHAKATRVALSLADAEHMVRLDIRDDGVGFSVPGWEQQAPADGSGYGLRFMRARLRELGGGLDIESAPGQGTAISAFAPTTLGGNR